jgi:hypothetical protein
MAAFMMLLAYCSKYGLLQVSPMGHWTKEHRPRRSEICCLSSLLDLWVVCFVNIAVANDAAFLKRDVITCLNMAVIKIRCSLLGGISRSHGRYKGSFVCLLLVYVV